MVNDLNATFRQNHIDRHGVLGHSFIPGVGDYHIKLTGDILKKNPKDTKILFFGHGSKLLLPVRGTKTKHTPTCS